MNTIKILSVFGTIATVLAIGAATPANAQATRTWVSGVGDDVNPCSRTAPCKTFAGAISKTAAGGEINCLDPGGFGAVTIIKSMVISCPYTEGGALAGGNGIVVNMPATTDVTVIRGLDIFGVNPPTNGIRFVNNGTLIVEDTVIRRFNAANSFCISYQPSGASRLFITNTSITQNGNGSTGGGILIQPTGAGGSARVEMENVRVLENAGVGIRADSTGNSSPAGTLVAIRNARFSSSPTGVSAVMPAGSSQVTMHVLDSMVNFNGNFGITATGTGTAIVRVGNSLITGNGVAVAVSGGGTVTSYGDNITDGNAAVSGFSGPAPPKT